MVLGLNAGGTLYYPGAGKVVEIVNRGEESTI